MLQARLDGGTTGQEAQPANAGQAVTPITLPESLQRALRVLLAEAEHDVEHFKIQLEQWFNNGMERVSGWYKRETQFILLILAVLLTIGSNADTLKIVNTLWRDPTVRSATIAQAQAYMDQANKTATTPVSTPPPAPAEQGSDNLKAASKNLADAIDRLDGCA